MDKNKTRVAFVGAGVVLALAFTLLSVSLTSAAVNAVTVSGQAALPGGGLPVPDGTWAWLLNPDQTIHAQSQVVTATGDFSFAGVTPGAYLVRVVPPANDLTYAPSNIWPVPVLTTPVSLPGALELTTPSVTGTVYAPDGITPVDARVQVYAGPLLVEDRPTVAGDFALGGLPAGTYALIAEPLPDDAYWHSHVTAVTLNPSTTGYVSLTL